MTLALLQWPLFAAASVSEVTDFVETMDSSEMSWRFWVFLGVIAINALFVMAEFAIVKIRSSQLSAAASLGHPAAKLALEISQRLERYLSTTQLGITMMSIASGSIGEPLVASIVKPLLLQVGVENGAVLHSLSLVISFTLVTFPVVILGEQIPKRMALRYTLPITLWLARPLKIISRITAPLTYLLNRCTNLVLKLVFPNKNPSAAEGSFSDEEYRQIFADSARNQGVTNTEYDILKNVLYLNDICARDVMTPRLKVKFLDIDEPFEKLVAHAIKHQHTRYPLVKGHLDEPVGLVHMKSLMAIYHEGKRDIRLASTPIMSVPEMMVGDQLLQKLRAGRAHLALVLDEYGGTVGTVTIDDIVEEFVGEIQDEFDEGEELDYEYKSEDTIEADGTLSLHQFAKLTGIQVETEDAGTLGGYITELRGRLPNAGHTITFGDWTATILGVSNRHIQRIRLTRSRPADAEAKDDS